MNTVDQAQTMVNYYATVTPLIRQQPVFMQYSNHKELKTDNSPNQVVMPLTHTNTRLTNLYVCSTFVNRLQHSAHSTM